MTTTAAPTATVTRPLRIAMVGLRGIPATHGGVERAVEQLAVELAGRGHAVTVYARTGYCETRAPEYRGVRMRYLPEVDTKHLEAPSHTVLAVLDALRSREFDVIHFHATGPGMFSVLPKLAGVPSVVTVQGLDYRREKWGTVASAVLKLALRVTATAADQTIVVSRALERELRERYDAAPVYSPNGIDPSELDAVEPVDGLEAGRFLLFLGRLVPEKGVHTLLEAFRGVDTDLPLAIAGGGTHTSEYVQQLERTAAADPRVRMLGPVYGAQKAWLLSSARLFVQPSTLEGLPIAVLEASAGARPCVVSDLPEHLEIVGDDGAPCATTFHAGDAASLTDALTRALAMDDGDAVGQGRALRDRVLERYRWPAIADTTEEVYRDVLDRRASRRRSGRAGRARIA